MLRKNQTGPMSFTTKLPSARQSRLARRVCGWPRQTRHVSAVYMVEGATPDRQAFWGSVGPRDLKPAVIRAGACVATRQPGWARHVCGRPRRTRHVSAVRF
jgi:hypothetical protein